MCFHSVCIVIICLINCTLQFITLGLIVYLVYYRHSDLGFPDSLVGKKSACNAGDLGSMPGLGRSPGEGKGYPLQCSGLLLGRQVMTNLDSIFKSRDYFASKGPSSQGYGFSFGHVWM